MTSRRKVRLVTCREVSEDNRVACAIHHTLNEEDKPMWLMVPIDKDDIPTLDAVVLITLNGDVYEFTLDDL